jgi:hypothetical protein
MASNPNSYRIEQSCLGDYSDTVSGLSALKAKTCTLRNPKFEICVAESAADLFGFPGPALSPDHLLARSSPKET